MFKPIEKMTLLQMIVAGKSATDIEEAIRDQVILLSGLTRDYHAIVGFVETAFLQNGALSHEMATECARAFPFIIRFIDEHPGYRLGDTEMVMLDKSENLAFAIYRLISSYFNDFLFEAMEGRNEATILDAGRKPI